MWDAEGHHLGTIEMPEQPANLVWGDNDYQTLYITATTSVYRLRMKVRGFRAVSQTLAGGCIVIPASTSCRFSDSSSQFDWPSSGFCSKAGFRENSFGARVRSCSCRTTRRSRIRVAAGSEAGACECRGLEHTRYGSGDAKEARGINRGIPQSAENRPRRPDCASLSRSKFVATPPLS